MPVAADRALFDRLMAGEYSGVMYGRLARVLTAAGYEEVAPDAEMRGCDRSWHHYCSDKILTVRDGLSGPMFPGEVRRAAHHLSHVQECGGFDVDSSFE